MIGKTYENIVNGIEVRQNVSLLRKELKADGAKYGFLFELAGEFSVLEGLLYHEDPKTRKNAALLMGDLGDKRLLAPLYEAYEKETTLFVRSAYLTALKEFDYREYLPELKIKLDLLSKEELTEENKKHITEEMKGLSDLIILMEGVKAHTFTGYKKESELVLLTNRNFNHVVLEQVNQMEGVRAKTFGAGLMVLTNNLEEILKIRTIEEILFALQKVKTCPAEPEKAARKLIDGGLLPFLKERHKEKAPFYFRIEVKSKMPLDKKSTFARKMAVELERLSDRSLINTTSKYEVEIRLIENKEGSWNVLLKLYGLLDQRFSYRLETLPTSIKPVNAALMLELAEDYLKEEAKVLDPFCGTGTMLVERHKKRKANTLYGIDIYGDAIEKARINTEEAHLIIHYINRDFFDFTHEYQFDEIITNMPAVTGRKTKEEIALLYKQFFEKSKTHLNEGGIIVLYTHNRELVEQFGPKEGFTIKDKWEISMKEGTYVFVLSL